MDSLTHIAVGACIGELVAGKKLGKKAMLLGALGQSIPDIDFVTGYWMSTAADLLAHRGFTHSILFAVLITVGLAAVSARVFRGSGLAMRQWCFFWGIQLFMHLFLDIFNVYGTGLFEPFSHYRVSLNIFFVLDPLFSLWPVIGLAILIAMRTGNVMRAKAARLALSISAFYMCYSIINKLIINNRVKQSFSAQQLPVHRYFSTPTALNNLLWYVVGETDSGFYVGYHSLLDKSNTIIYRYVPQHKYLLTNIADTGELQRLMHFSQGYFVASRWHDTVVFNDLRFGEQVAGLSPTPRFSFYYYLYPGADNDVIIQRGRFAGWNGDVVRRFWERIHGQ